MRLPSQQVDTLIPGFALYRSTEVPMAQGTLTIQSLSSELRSVSRWHQLGITLGLKLSQLDQIEEEACFDVERRRVKVLDAWMRNTPRPSWKLIVDALKEMGEMDLAMNIKQKYLHREPASLTDSPTLLQVDATPLELNDDYYNVLSELNPLAAHWKNIGFALRLKPDALEKINREHSGDLSACLASMVKEWLKRNYNVERFGEPTWQRLAEAVGDPAGGADKALSMRIAEKHTQRLSALIEAKQTPSSPQESAVTQAQETVTSSPPTPSFMSNHLSLLRPPFQPAVVPSAISSPPNQQADQNTGILLAITLQDPSAAVAQHNIMMIRGRFAMLVTESRKRLQYREIEVEDIQTFLITIYSSPNSRDGSGMVMTILESAKNLNEIFRTLGKYGLWDYLNYFLLQSIIKEFAHDDKKLNSLMEQYQQDLTGHILALRIQTYLDATHHPITMSDSDNSADEVIPLEENHELFKKLTAKYKVNVTDHTLSYVIDLWQSLAKQFALPQLAMIFHKVAEGCISITWLIPANLVKYVMQMAHESANMFAKENVLRVTLEEQCIYSMETKLVTELVTDHTLLDSEPSGLERAALKGGGGDRGLDLPRERSLQASGTPTIQSHTLTIQSLSSELRSVSKWHQLGITLGLKLSQLDQIEEEARFDVECRRVKVLDAWMRNTPRPSWKLIVDALKELGEMDLAMNIEQKCIHREPGNSSEVSPRVSPREVFMRKNRLAITSKFAHLLIKICNKMLRNGNVDVAQFRLFVIAFFHPGDCIPSLPTSLIEVFEAITHNGLWDFFHYSPLVTIVQTFGANDPDMNEWVQGYKKDLKAYISTTQIEDYIDFEIRNPMCTEPHPARSDLRYYSPVEWKTPYVDHTLQYLAEVWEKFSSHYLLPDSPPTALLDRDCRGCVSITWLVPTHMIPQLIKGVESSTEFFQEHKISKVTVEGKCVYERKMLLTNVPLLETTRAKLCGHGKYPSVTLNNSNTIVAVHNSDIGSTLKCRIGVVSEVDRSFSIDWGKDRRYGAGFFPRVSMNNDGIVVEVHQSLMREVRYRIGRVNEGTKTIDWWQEGQTIEDGYAPAVALTDNGHVVVVYENNRFTTYKTYYCLGIVDFESKTIRWTVQRIPYGSGGQNLSISMNNEGTIVEVHRSPAGVNFSNLWLCIGKLNLDDQHNPIGISWNDAVEQGKYRYINRFLPSSLSNPQSSPYSFGYYPFVSINNDGKFIEVHQTLALRRLVYRVGAINEDTIQWSQSKECQYDMGWSPVVALNDHNLVVEIHGTNIAAYRGNTWWSKIGSLTVSRDQ